MTSTLLRPSLGRIVRHSGVAGQLAYSVLVTYPGETAGTVVTFVGSVFGGRPVMITRDMPGGVFVTDPDRFGPFGPEWVRAFFA